MQRHKELPSMRFCFSNDKKIDREDSFVLGDEEG